MLPYTANDMLSAIRRTYAIDPSPDDTGSAPRQSSRRRVQHLLVGTLSTVRSLLLAL